MTEDELDVMCDNVFDRPSLANYLIALSKNAEDNPDKWENLTAAHYIESISAVLIDNPFLQPKRQKKLPEWWNFVAQLMTSGKYYE